MLHLVGNVSKGISVKHESFFRQILEKSSNIIFRENPVSGSRAVRCGQTDGQTDMTKLIVAFRNVARTHLKNL